MEEFSTWTRLSGSRTTYKRPLGTLELAFYWDEVFKGTGDIFQHAQIVMKSGNIEDVIGPSNVSRAWTNLKLQYPLLGARIERRNPDSIFFVVDEENLASCRSGEINFKEVANLQSVIDVFENILLHEQFPDDLLARIYIFQRTDLPDHFHLVTHTSHCINDGVSNMNILRTFFDRLCDDSPSGIWNLAHQLALSPAMENLVPPRKFNVARRRWRMAIAKVISSRRASAQKGGHTLPCKVSQLTPYIPAQSKSLSVSFSIEQSRVMILNCRKNDITFGNAFPVIGQVALSRFLLKKYLRGEIAEEEWQFRKREPMFSAVAINMRPYLDEDWIKEGGLTHICVAIGFYVFSLPFMPLGSAANLTPGMEMPSFDNLFSRERFFMRCKSVKNQAANHLKHPLFIELSAINGPAGVQRAKAISLQWQSGAYLGGLSGKPFSPMEQASMGVPVTANGGGTFGNDDHILPRIYPTSQNIQSKGTVLHLLGSTFKLRCRPTELYLGALTSGQQLHLGVFFDENVYDENIVVEWLQEVKNSIEFYLG